MKILRVDRDRPEPAVIAAAAAVLRKGGLVAMPTETVYGLATNALDAEAIERVFAAKGRPSFNPLIAHAPSLAKARELADPWPEAAELLGGRFWPGPLTLVVPKARHIPDRLTGGLPTVAVRVPNHPVALALLNALPFPLAAPSANRFTQLSPTSPAHVRKELADRVDLILDAGASELGIESTVVDVSGPEPILLRPGALGSREIEEVLGCTLLPPADISGDAPRPGPGMIDRHYSPRAELKVVSRSELPETAAAATARGEKVGVLLIDGRDATAGASVRVMTATAAGYSAQLYAALHDMDDEGCDIVLVEEPPHHPDWAAVRDRLSRAARPR